jgi:hypothetical protein
VGTAALGCPVERSSTGFLRQTGIVRHYRALLGKEVIERLHRLEFVVLDIKNGVQLRDVENVVHFLGKVHKFELSAVFFHSNKAADQLPDPGTVDVAHIGKIEQDFLFLFSDKPRHRVAQLRRLIPENDAPAEVEDGNVMALATGDLQAQFSSASWRSGVMPSRTMAGMLVAEEQ